MVTNRRKYVNRCPTFSDDYSVTEAGESNKCPTFPD